MLGKRGQGMGYLPKLILVAAFLIVAIVIIFGLMKTLGFK
jgi:hypothetical protein